MFSADTDLLPLSEDVRVMVTGGSKLPSVSCVTAAGSSTTLDPE